MSEQEVLIVHANFGMLALDSVLKLSAVTTMKSQMRALIVQETNQRLQVQMVLRVSIMYSRALALRCFKDTRMRLARSSSILRVTRLLQLRVTRLVRYGRPKQAMSCKLWMDMRTKFSHVPLTTRVTLSLLGPRTTLAAFGKTSRLCRHGTNKIEKRCCCC